MVTDPLTKHVVTQLAGFQLTHDIALDACSFVLGLEVFGNAGVEWLHFCVFEPHTQTICTGLRKSGPHGRAVDVEISYEDGLEDFEDLVGRLFAAVLRAVKELNAIST